MHVHVYMYIVHTVHTFRISQLHQESRYEAIILMDMQRTYLGHNFFHEKESRDSLYKICKAYSIYDDEVGYCQGLSFIIAVLLLQVRWWRGMYVTYICTCTNVCTCTCMYILSWWGQTSQQSLDSSCFELVSSHQQGILIKFT